MTINSERVINYMKEHYGEEMTKQKIAEDLGISIPPVTATINFLVKNGFATVREESYEETPATETKGAKMGVRKYHTLTEAGLAYDPVAAEEAKLAAKQAERERKKAEKAAAAEG